jgi:hypothetical protein
VRRLRLRLLLLPVLLIQRRLTVAVGEVLAPLGDILAAFRDVLPPLRRGDGGGVVRLAGLDLRAGQRPARLLVGDLGLQVGLLQPQPGDRGRVVEPGLTQIRHRLDLRRAALGVDLGALVAQIRLLVRQPVQQLLLGLLTTQRLGTGERGLVAGVVAALQRPGRLERLSGR